MVLHEMRDLEMEVVTELLSRWRDPVWNESYERVPARLVLRLTEMALEASATAVGHRIFYERVHCLLVVASIAGRTDLAAIPSDQPPSDDERRLGNVFGQAFHQGCSLADVAFAADLQAQQVVAIGKRTIRRTGWLKRI